MNIDTFYSFRLRKEARKPWNYILTYEFVYAVDLIKSEWRIKRWYIKCYICSDFYREFAIKHGNYYSIAIVEVAR